MALVMPPGTAVQGCTLRPPMISTVVWPYLRAWITLPPISRPTFRMTPRMLRSATGVSGPMMKSGPPRMKKWVVWSAKKKAE
jgi:hypothetical protein